MKIITVYAKSLTKPCMKIIICKCIIINQNDSSQLHFNPTLKRKCHICSSMPSHLPHTQLHMGHIFAQTAYRTAYYICSVIDGPNCIFGHHILEHWPPYVRVQIYMWKRSEQKKQPLTEKNFTHWCFI